MENTIKIRTNLLSPISASKADLKLDYIITIDQGTIVSIIPWSVGQQFDLDARDALAIPGLIDLHVHLSQYRIKGHYRDALLPWLQEFVFPEEQFSADYDYAYGLAEDFFNALYKNGTTTAVIYTAPYKTACEAAFDVARLQNFRAFIGMTLMNQNCPQPMLHNTEQIKTECEALINEYHDPANDLQFILTPRFAPTCSMDLMQWIGEFASKNDLWIQTHLSENLDEIDWVKEIFGCNSYTEVYHKAGLLTAKTILAHCIHLADTEMNMIKDSGSKIAHCPDSNFFLRSGQFPVSDIIQKDIPYALGSDVGAGTSLNMLYHAKIYSYRQAQTKISPTDAFYRITLGAAKVLNLDSKIGSLEAGKAADIVLLNLPDTKKPLTDDVLSELIFTGHEWQIAEVYAKGIRHI
jgi:guanine deaminase